MGNKRDIKIFIVPVLICLVFLFGIIGYKELTGPEFSLPGAIYSTLFFFILNNISPEDAISNPYLLISRYLAAIVFGLGIYSLVYRHLYRQYIKLRIKYTYKGHVIVFSMEKLGTSIFTDLLTNKYKVILAEGGEAHPYLETIRKEGIIHFSDAGHTDRLFDTMHVSRARACVIAFDDDNVNIELSLKLIRYLRGKGAKTGVLVLPHISKAGNMELMKDHIDVGGADNNFEFEVFNIYSAAAKKIYDHYSPHRYFDFKDESEERSIAVIGYNQAAEEFITENIILSHYKGCRNIKIFLVDRNADDLLHELMYKYPFCREYVDIVPVKLLNDKFFANFNWSKELIEKLSKVKCAYLFGDNGAELVNVATRFRQFLAGQIEPYLKPGIVVCFPEDSNIMGLLDEEKGGREQLAEVLKNQMNIDLMHLVADSCTSSRLLEESEYVDMLSRVINYYYSIKYEFGQILKEKWHIADDGPLVATIDKKLLELQAKQQNYGEAEIENLVLREIANETKSNVGELMAVFGIRERWNMLSYRKKSANRYAARHMAVKINIMENMGCMPLTHENILHSFPVIAPVEHKRWCAEKMVLNYRFGILPKDKATKNIVKERLKIHDQLIPYDKLADAEKQKDLDIFLLMPLLTSLKMENKK